jgi:tRNA nucleotidyltransferase (CCA-adding enzyme)
MSIDNSQSGSNRPLPGIYLVGGAVRDKLLNIQIVDRDWVVVGATVDDMLDRGFQPVSGDFPVFLHPETGEEYALARREVKTGHGYHGFSVEFGSDVSLEEDLARRDLTINAMAEDESGSITDPYNGQQDLQNGLLRHVTPAFAEDPVRLLRIARFAARLGCRGFHVAHATHGLMKKMVAAKELQYLPGQRVWHEMSKALMDEQPWRFFEALHACAALAQLFPVLAQILSDASGHEDHADSQPIAILRRAGGRKLELSLRFVAVMQFAVDGDHSAGELCRFLEVGKKLTALLITWLQVSPLFLEMHRKQATDYYQYLTQAQQYSTELETLVEVCLPDIAKQVLPWLNMARTAMKTVDVRELQQQGWQGKELGEELKQQQIQAIDQILGKTDEG